MVMNKPEKTVAEANSTLGRERRRTDDQDSKKYVVVDAEFHYLPSGVFKKVDETVFESKDGKALQDWMRDPQKKPAAQRLQSIEGALRHMDECGVDMAMIMMPGWEMAGIEVCKILNDGLAKAAKENPGRFLPMAAVPFIEGQRSVDELTRVKNDLGLNGVAILTNQRGIRLDDEQVKPFFRKAVQLGLPVFVHPPAQERGLWGGTKYDMDGSVSREYEIIKTFVEVLCGVLPEFPELNFIFAHFGGGVPSLLWRIMSWYTPPESYGIPKGKIHVPMTIREFEDYGLKGHFDKLFDRFYFDMAGTGGWMSEAKHALSVIKPERLAFGSDYPHEMSRPADYKAYLDGIKGLDIPEEDKVRILGGNMKVLFKA
jgi:predicted TIM-barrel fold metal-dependent hydrolase